MASSRDIRKKTNLMLVAALAANVLFWFGSSDLYAKWDGVPPVPTQEGAVMMALGDSQFAYRLGAITLQNLGDGGGRVTPMKDYQYDKLGKWFWLLHGLDPASDHVPMLAAYYFGGTRVPKDVAVVVEYLAAIGQNPAGAKWRWLVQAVFLARHRLNDPELALDLAYKLSKMQLVDDTMPAWGRQMPAFILQDKGDREDARRIIKELLLTGHGFHPNEINFMAGYLVETLGVDPREVETILRARGQGDTYHRPKPAPQAE